MNNKEQLLEIANVLEKAERVGSETEIAEGARVIIISDVLAKMITSTLREIANNIAEPSFREVMESIQQMPCDTCDDCDLQHMMCKCWDKETIDKILELFKQENDK